MYDRSSELEARKGGDHLTPGILDGTFHRREFPSAIKEFVQPGGDIARLLMRTFITDERKANAAVMFLDRCRTFKDKRHEKMLLNWLAIQCSIKGRARSELLQAVVGQLYSGDGKGKVKKREEAKKVEE